MQTDMDELATTLEANFRLGMRRVAAAVNVITISVDGTPMGMTATAFSSLAAHPPSLLVCVNRAVSMHAALCASSHFCVNVLHADQSEIADCFSSSRLREARFAQGGWINSEISGPYLPDAQVVFQCELEQMVDFATHTICIGRVAAVRLREKVDPLMYVDGKYSRMQLSPS